MSSSNAIMTADTVEARALLDQLLAFARTLNLEVRVEPFSRPGRNAGGICVLRGRRVVLIDGGAPLVEQTSALAEALAEIVEPDTALTGASVSARLAIHGAAARREWRRDPQDSPLRVPPIQRRISVLRRPKPGLRAIRPKR